MIVSPRLGQGIPPDHLVLNEALAQKRGKITELSEGGSVPELRFISEGEKTIFLIDVEGSQLAARALASSS
jgi:hypothetical protein